MIDLNKIQVPTSIEEDLNKNLTRWKDGRIVSIDEGSRVTFYVGHEVSKELTEQGPENLVEKEITRAFPISVTKPYNRDAAINAAEMQAYNLTSAMDVASFTASMARKFRDNPNDEEVIEHDEFIGWVKEELSKIGI